VLRFIFNYYIVLKTCWIILVFQLIGFFGLVVMDQGKDILQSLSFSTSGIIKYHTWFALLAVLWWSWQSWRAARITLHFTTLDFAKFNQKYALQAQVFVPRLLGILPALIFALGLYQVSGWSNPLVYLYVSLALWLYVLYHLRKDIIVFFMSRNKIRFLNIPDYVMVKNEAYPARFIWAKQGYWILFRLFLVAVVFTIVILEPVAFPQLLGAATIVLFALGAWLVIAVFLDYAEKRLRFPFAFSLIVMVIGFSFLNNNHKIRKLDTVVTPRKDLATHFDQWYAKRAGKDTVPVVLVASQGGGVRSAYWTAQVLSELQTTFPNFSDYTYAYSGVSGGSLGIGTFKTLVKAKQSHLREKSHTILNKDFLSPITSWLVIPDLVQKFLPFPVYAVDRARALEYSWEKASEMDTGSLLQEGFLNAWQQDESVVIFNATRVENGFRTLVSNVQTPPTIFHRTEDFFRVVENDIRLSTAISVSARFPFITPPAVIESNGKKWGHLVDGGYVENMGAASLLELYRYIAQRAKDKHYKTKFILLFIKNTKEEYSQPLTGLHEILGPVKTFSKVWVNSGYYDKEHTALQNLSAKDQVHFVSLNREDETIIPLGWYLSPKSTELIQQQVAPQTQAIKAILQAELSRVSIVR
jgi:predicted acylesterase/phospholipase RssA